MIPYGRHSISQQDIDHVVEVLKTKNLTQGEAVPDFEDCVANYVGVAHAVAVNSATSGLHLACLALGLKNNDVVWTSPISFVASANCALYCGATVDFVDIDLSTYNMCMFSLRKKLELAKILGRLPKIVIAVHFSGLSCDMMELKRLALEYGFYIIEDASHALGAMYNGTQVGSCEYSDATVFSFHPVKMITTGEGGIVTTRQKSTYDQLKALRSHGIIKDQDKMINSPDGPWYYEQQMLGFNYRMTDFQAALGISQMSQLKDFLDKRKKIAQFYFDNLISDKINVPKICENNHSSWHIFVIRFAGTNGDQVRDFVFRQLLSSGINVQVHYIPIHLQPYYQSIGFKRGDFPVAESYYSTALTLPIYPTLELENCKFVVKTIQECLN